MADPPILPPASPPPQHNPNGPINPITGTPPAAAAAAAAGNAAAVSAIPVATVPEKDRLPKEGDEIVTEAGRLKEFVEIFRCYSPLEAKICTFF
ncbi:hypothetical protein B9Z55_002734 [Caenorhabditis nigoni]|uniref:Uncharacterized protein n=1 Tax=Caenorhabditis nigoni TaxID=1611254 RepID=A0A2G5VM57_9PELO|nr:hypothetical protein B9Z55_002734 [Caenorhabditis nigoni]